jgi:RNA 2',3'-cyclic 3'-phosphodiesterase
MSFRAFISVDIAVTESVRDMIHDLKVAGPDLKVVDPSRIHVTLKFLGETKEEMVDPILAVMSATTMGVRPFTMILRGTGAFPSKNRIRVVWLGMDDALPLGTIASRLDEGLAALGMEREKRPFAPHLTVARTRQEVPRPSVRKVIEDHAQTEFGRFEVDRIRLKRSVLAPAGPRYSTVGEVILG